MTRDEFLHTIEWEGWHYVLTEIDPDWLDDAALGEVLQEAQDAFSVLTKQLPELEREDYDPAPLLGGYWDELADFD